ncbi:glycosyl transferase family protein [Erythrobacter sp. EC-HK427]|uniref:glycosyl transferase family protein n=1 Tax=Erythrobacter sp. EC-HK427 TaxID=2038396 RepID=UPI00125A7E55|nr:glycosyl transferase family protein [Erythrobacter sp. EC-HK427]VVS98227.1 conserved membrane hypothetical protein [Erythrobacter sp. EC-HK427]
MELGALSLLQWLAVIEHELLLFAGVFFLIGALDEMAVDSLWLWHRLRGKLVTHSVSRADLRHRHLSGPTAVFIPTWQEQEVIGPTLSHALAAWPQKDLLFYIGCYRNDPATLQAAMGAAGNDPRVRLIVHDVLGPTTKADCLNRLYRAMQQDERRRGSKVRAVILHDAEDVVDAAALSLIDHGLEHNDFVQLPVLPLIDPQSRWVASHYCEEFAEAHGKALVVRDMLRVGIPAAGVGCGFRRSLLGNLAAMRGSDAGPFSGQSLTEDYELGLSVTAQGGRGRFLRVRGEDGSLVATRSYFPADLPAAVRQKARWMHGIALQGWDSLGWSNRLAENWMRLRDRRGPLAALVLLAGYVLFVLAGMLMLLDLFGFERTTSMTPLLWTLLVLNFAALLWRMAMRFAFTARDYGVGEGLRAVLRMPVANVIAIMAARRALVAYGKTLLGQSVVWDKTVHDRHPLDAAAPPRLAAEGGQ